MNIVVQPSYESMSRAAADFTADYVRKNPRALLCVTSGDTPTGMYKYLVEDAREGKVNFNECTFVGLDEWEGLDGSFEGSCRHYLDQHLFLPLDVKADKILCFDGSAQHLDEECRRIDEYISERGPIDLMLVGLGLNGHIGLNEPGVDFNQYSHVSELASITKNTATKYFKQEVSLTGGITLGLRHLLDANIAVIIASGSQKAKVVASALEGQITNEIPASIIQKHRNGYVFLDRHAAALLSDSTQHDEG
jgi:glucosamine-6-phosphate isomerase